MFKVIKNKLFMKLFLADMVSDFGDSLYYLALMSYVLMIPETSLAISLVTLSEIIPILLLVFIGIKADQAKQKVNKIIYTLLFRAILYLIVGFAMGFTPALWIVIVAIVLNLFSDLAGKYESFLYIPISLKIVTNDDREASIAFRSAVSSMLQIIFKSSGSVLILWLTYQQLAYFNALTFVISLLIVLSISKTLKSLLQEDDKTFKQEQKYYSNKKESWFMSLKNSWIESKRIPSLMMSLTVLIFVNALFSVIPSLFILSLKQTPNLSIISNEISIVAVNIVVLCGTILGSLVTTNIFKEFDTFKSIKLVGYLIPVVFIGLILENGYLVLLSVLFSAIIAGVINPKFSAMIYNSIPEDKLATFSAGLNVLLQTGIIVLQLLFSGAVLILSAKIISYILLGFSMLLLVYIMCYNRQK